MASEPSAGSAFAGLTTKQCEVLDLLIQHKTSKEISRLLGISPHTVDQRILLARGKLQAGTRSETAQAYRRLLADQQKTSDPDIYQRSIYGSPDVADAAQWAQALDRETTEDYGLTGLPAETDWTETPPQQRAGSASGKPAQVYVHVLPEAFDGQGGTLLRLGAIVVITVLTTLMILGGMAMYTELAHMLDG